MKRDPIPDHFSSIEEASEFWDSHDLADYWDLTSEAHFDFLADPDKECELREGMMTALERSIRNVREGGALYSADDITKDFRAWKGRSK
jgi:hypothetical protein